jgi:exopolyphosphatase/guanosine-5'-triphosphate,3'-diphosphate pyrophosphatase
MRLATIDLGTNTVRLLVTDVDPDRVWRSVHADQQVTRLGEGLSRSGLLGEIPMQRTAAVVAEYARRARSLGAGVVRIVATSAVREATNGPAFVATVEAVSGERIQVISGADEARLTVRGVLRGLGRLPGAMVTFDVGGGSTEYTLARDGVAMTTVSLRLGVVALAERFPFPDMVDPARFRALADEVAAQLERELPRSLIEPRPDHLVGTAGTVTTLAALDLGLSRYDVTRVQGHRLHRAAVARQFARLAALTLSERAELPCLEPGRADLIIPGVAIVEATMQQFGARSLIVSDWGLREGMVDEAIEDLFPLVIN